MRRVHLSGGWQVAITDYSNQRVEYWSEIYYDLDLNNAVFNDYDELIYEGYDSIFIGERKNIFLGYYYNTETRRFQNEPFVPTPPTNTSRPRGQDPPATDEQKNNPQAPVFYDGIAERKNGGVSLNGTQVNPYLQPYTGKTVEDRIKYLKAVLKWYEVEIRSLSTTLKKDVEILKRWRKLDDKEQKVIQLASIALSSAGIAGLILGGVSALFGLVNNNNSTRVELTNKITLKTALLEKYLKEYNTFKREYDTLIQDSGSSDDFISNNKKVIYWIVGVVVFGVIIYFLVRRK